MVDDVYKENPESPEPPVGEDAVENPVVPGGEQYNPNAQYN